MTAWPELARAETGAEQRWLAASHAGRLRHTISQGRKSRWSARKASGQARSRVDALSGHQGEGHSVGSWGMSKASGERQRIGPPQSCKSMPAKRLPRTEAPEPKKIRDSRSFLWPLYLLSPRNPCSSRPSCRPALRSHLDPGPGTRAGRRRTFRGKSGDRRVGMRCHYGGREPAANRQRCHRGCAAFPEFRNRGFLESFHDDALARSRAGEPRAPGADRAHKPSGTRPRPRGEIWCASAESWLTGDARPRG